MEFLDLGSGTGEITAVASLFFRRAVGVEINPKLAARAAENLQALNLPLNIVVGDARTIAGNFTTAVIDFPYGRSSQVTPDLYAEILLNLRPQVSRMAVVVQLVQDRKGLAPKTLARKEPVAELVVDRAAADSLGG